MTKITCGTFTLFLLLLLIACEQPPDPETVISKTTIPFPKEYKILDFKSDWGVGESTEDYTLLISLESYKQIKKEIENKDFFLHLDTAKLPMYAFRNNSDMKKIKETACWFDNKYFYQIFNPNPGFIVTMILEKDSLVVLCYEDL